MPQTTAMAAAETVGAMMTPVTSFWAEDTQNQNEADRVFRFPNFGFFQEQKTTKKRDKRKPWTTKFGPGGAVGIGCGAGIGVAVTGGAGVGATPWSALKLVLGIGVGCGAGLGYGYGMGLGVRWDRPPPKKTAASKRTVMEV